MKTIPSRLQPLAFAALALAATAFGAHAHDHRGGIQAPAAVAVKPAFDIRHSTITTEGRMATFHVAVSGKAGSSKPVKHGKLAGSSVFSYVWPTSLDPSSVGFDAKSGILAFAVTAHPDFDDTPLYDENGDGDPRNDGNVWHSHWVVLQPDDACGKGALKVVDIPGGAKPRLPKTWPGLPLLIDSPGYHPTFIGHSLDVQVPLDDIASAETASFDGVTAVLRVNASVHAPLLCVADVMKVASGNLSLPGKVNQ